MNLDAPAIYSPRLQPARLALAGRMLAIAGSAGCLCVLCTAAKLTPNPAGVATHMDLGLAPCSFLIRTGLPCPFCGMTTSFAWFVRGNFLASAYVQPMGMILAAITVIVFWTAMYEAITGRAVHRLLELVPSRYYIAFLGCAIIAWMWKIFIHLHGIDGWHS